MPAGVARRRSVAQGDKIERFVHVDVKGCVVYRIPTVEERTLWFLRLYNHTHHSYTT